VHVGNGPLALPGGPFGGGHGLMRLSTKIIIGATTIVVLVNLAALPLMGWRYEAQLREGLTEAARSYYKLIVIVRGWVAEHEGVLVPAQPGIEPNPYLATPALATEGGDTLFWRNPALVTRELSELSRAMDNRVQFRVTSLDPMNPANALDAFEERALRAAMTGDRSSVTHYGEVTGYETVDGVRHFRYFAPLYAEESCASCHASNGYEVGAVRGGISITMPADHLAAATTQSYLYALLLGLLASGAVSVLIFLLIRRLVITPLRRLEDAAGAIGRGDYDAPVPEYPDDEIGDVGRAMANMQQAIRLSVSRQVETEKLSALGHLSAGIAHEIRNPLFAIRNDLDYLSRVYASDPRQREVYDDMEAGVQRIGSIVSAVLGYARPHSSEHGEHTFRDVIDQCMALLGKQLETERIGVEIDLDAHLPAMEMDAHQMEQVFVNLITNAMRARDGETGLVRITGRAVDGQVELQIQDDGRGMESSDLTRIFDPFFTRSPDGTGLGLTIVRRIVEQHNGSIEVDSQPGRGATFTLRFPVRQPADERTMQPA
jgi:two-component system, NtrC family, sensor kinase